MPVAVRLGLFVLLIAVVFLVAYLVGAWVGPVGAVHGTGGGGGMRMSEVFAQAVPKAGA